MVQRYKKYLNRFSNDLLFNVENSYYFVKYISSNVFLDSL